MTTNRTSPELLELHRADAAMRAAWEAFRAAHDERQAAAARLGASVGGLRVSTWTSEGTLSMLSEALDALPSGQALDLAAGRAVLERQAREAAAERRLREQREAAERVAEASAAITRRLNRQLNPGGDEAARALAALDAEQR